MSELTELLARHADLVRVMLRRRLTDAEHSEMDEVEGRIEALAAEARQNHPF
jgi:hypothetical protein